MILLRLAILALVAVIVPGHDLVTALFLAVYVYAAARIVLRLSLATGALIDRATGGGG
jgi:hypothetical protein